MILRTLLVLAVLCGLLSAALSGQEQDLVPVELRVRSASGRGRLVVDRGSTDGLEAGDMVLFFPRGGGMLAGSVLTVENRSAVVELLDASLTVPPGTRGEAMVPPGRLAPEPAEQDAPEGAAEGAPPASRWENQDEEWLPTMPLLSGIESVQPSQRPSRMRGRLYLFLDATTASEGDRSDSFLRLGQDIELENPFGRGGALHLDSEWNQRTTELPDQRDENESYLRLDRLSYHEGGTRFSDLRWEAGRFLQDGMPEFGLLDGGEVSYRLDRNHRFGASFGFMPEVDPELSTGEDLQAAAWWRWSRGDHEEFALTGGYQKTWNDGDADRDLIVTRVEYLPAEGWTAQGTAWIDLYTGSDVQGEGLELTQAHAVMSRRWAGGDGMSVTLSRVGFPDTIRDDTLPRPLREELVNRRNDRLASRGWLWWGEQHRLFAEGGVWNDEDDDGADGEFGLDWHDLLLEDSVATGSVFATYGEFENLYGARAALAQETSLGRWEVALEVSKSDQTSFPNDRDDINQYRLVATHAVDLAQEWSLSLFLETFLWDEEDSWSLGFYLQKSF